MTLPFSMHPVFIVDDEKEVLESEALCLALEGIEPVKTFFDPEAALDHFKIQNQGIVLLDISMPKMDGFEMLNRIREEYPGLTVIMLTGYNEASTAVRCMKAGAYDYLVKPVDSARLVASVRMAIRHRETQQEAQRLGQVLLAKDLRYPEAFEAIVSIDARMHDIFRYIEAIAPTRLPMLITGETGVGKELAAKAIHEASRLQGPFVAVNTAGIDDTLFSDTLFGHAGGAFTGGEKIRKGMIEKAKGGTLFLDEIGDLRPESQVKLLRLLQEGTYYPLGSDEEQISHTRIVAATNHSLEELRRDIHFRRDLYFRLQAHHVHFPPLRERHGDVALLVEHFLQAAAKEQGKSTPTVPRELMPLLTNYSFPGNIRELQGMVYDAVTRHQGGVMSLVPFREAIAKNQTPEEEQVTQTLLEEIVFPKTLPTLRQLEDALIHEALVRTQGNKKQAAEMIGLARETFRSRLKQLE